MKAEKIDFGLLGAQARQGHKNGARYDDGFYSWLLTTRGVSEGWARNLSYCLGRLMRSTGDPIMDEAKGREMARDILVSVGSPSTKRAYLVALESYLNYIGIPVKFKKPRDTARCPSYLSQEQMGKFVRVAINYQELALGTLFCSTGLRASEAVGLDMRDLDFTNKSIRVRHAKMNKEREVPMTDQLARVLKTYVGTLPPTGRGPNAPLFRGRGGVRMARRTVHKVVKRMGDRAGLQDIHPHMLRHSFATAWVENDGDVLHLKDILGHSRIEMTERYWHLNTKKKKEAFKRAAPKL